jgi:hypothetical protein
MRLSSFLEASMSARYLLLLLIVLYVVFELFIPAMQNIFGYGIGTLVALVILWYVFFSGKRGKTVL